MKKFLVVILVSFISLPVFSQFMSFEQDVRVPVNGTKLIPFTQISAEAPLKNGFSVGPYFGTTFDWTEVLWFLNYSRGPLSFGLGLGGEQTMDISWRISPWAKYVHTFADTSKSLAVFSLWEFGKGEANYWYTNSVTYESSKISTGILARRFYGVGPLFGWKIKCNNFTFKFSGALLYDFEDKVLKPTPIITITN